MKTAVFKYSLLLSFIISNPFSAWSDTFDTAVGFLEKNEIEKGLSGLYSYLASDTGKPDKYYLSLEKIIHYEKNIEKIIATIKNYSYRLKNNSKIMSEILQAGAELSELSGRTEDAVDFYISSYNIYPVPSNSISLLTSSRILIDNGEFNKAEKQLTFYKNLSLDKNSLYKADIIESLIFILSGRKTEGEKILSDLLKNDDISSENAASVLFISNSYNLENVSIESRKKLVQIDNNADIKTILSTNSMISPAFYFNYDDAISDKKDYTESEKVSVFLQTGSYSSMENAENMNNRLLKIGFNSTIIKSEYKGKIIFKVLVPAGSREEAQEYHIKLKEHSIESFMVFK